MGPHHSTNSLDLNSSFTGSQSDDDNSSGRSESPTPAHPMVHNPYTFPPGSAPPHDTEAHEEMLKELTLRFLHDEEFNPFACCVSVERLRLRVLNRSPYLFVFVVGQAGWKEFLRRHPDTFVVSSRGRGRIMVRSTRHTNWQDGETRQLEVQHHQNRILCEWLVNFLLTRPDQSSRISEVADASDGTVEIPARGDLIRFLTRRPTLFAYNQIDKTFRLAPHQPAESLPAACGPAQLFSPPPGRND